MISGATSVGPKREYIASASASACLATHYNAALGAEFSAQAIGMVFEQCTAQSSNFVTAEISNNQPLTPSCNIPTRTSDISLPTPGA